MEPRMGFEPTTPALRKRCSTVELSRLALGDVSERDNKVDSAGCQERRRRAFDPFLPSAVLTDFGSLRIVRLRRADLAAGAAAR